MQIALYLFLMLTFSLTSCIFSPGMKSPSKSHVTFVGTTYWGTAPKPKSPPSYTSYDMALAKVPVCSTRIIKSDFLKNKDEALKNWEQKALNSFGIPYTNWKIAQKKTIQLDSISLTYSYQGQPCRGK